MKRKKPVRHSVGSYTRKDGTNVSPHERGSGTKKKRYRHVVGGLDKTRLLIEFGPNPQDLYDSIDSVGGEFIGVGDWKDGEAQISMYKKLLELGDEKFKFFDVGAGSDTYYIVSVPRDVPTRKGEYVETITADKLWEDIPSWAQEDYLREEMGAR